jgi:hypothetical protein
MDRAAVEQLLDEMLSSLEDLETKVGATLQFLKDKGHATDKDLAPYLEQAGDASNVRWRAARLRMMSLLGAALKSVEPPPEAKNAGVDAKTDEVEKKGDAEKATTAQQDVQPKNEESQPTQAKKSTDEQLSDDSMKASDTPQNEASISEEQQPPAYTKSVEPKPSAPEEASETPTQASQDVRQSKQDAA